MQEKEFSLKNYKKDDDGKWIIPLEKPIKWGEDTIKELRLEEPKAKHIRDLSTNPKMGEMLDIVAKLAGEADSLIDELSMADATTCTEFFGAFS